MGWNKGLCVYFFCILENIVCILYLQIEILEFFCALLLVKKRVFC